MNIQNLILSVSIIALVAVSCANQSDVTNDSETNSVTENVSAIAKDVTVAEYKSLISDESIILDVRRSVEYEAGHLKDAVNIDWFDDAFMDKVNKLDKSKKLLIHCASGGRSSSAMNKLGGQGFAELYNMVGGFNAWKGAGYEFEK